MIHTIRSHFFNIAVAEDDKSFAIEDVRMPKELLAQIFQHGRSDFAAFADFLHGLTSYADLASTGTPSELGLRVIEVAQRFCAKLKVTNHSLGCLLMEATSPYTTQGSKR